MIILGIIGGFHDAAACLLIDGKVIALAEEERFTRKKHAFEAFPDAAADYCLKEAGIKRREIDKVTFSFDLDKLVESNEKVEPWRSSFAKNRRNLLRFREYYWNVKERAIAWTRARALPDPTFVDHHSAHLASAFFGSDFDSASLLSIDSRGELDTTVMGIGIGNEIREIKRIPLPHSLGMLYTSITGFLGYQMYDGEGTVMGLASYGKDIYRKEFDSIVKSIDGCLECEPDYLWNKFTDGFTDNENALEKLFGAPRHYRRDPRNGIDEHIAASLQGCVTRHVSRLVGWLNEKTGLKKLCIAGGVGLNSKMNGELLELDCVEELYVQPLANDAGGALGGAYWLYNKLTGKRPEPLRDVYLGPACTNDEIYREIVSRMLKFEKPDNLIDEVASLLVEGKVVGWVQGRMEAGPRALGARSILADPSREDVKDIVNIKVKNREPWRPFAATILDTHRDEYLINCKKAPFMIVCHKVKEGAYKKIKGACHIDGTSRVQVLERDVNPRFYDLIKRFGEITGVYALLNTSFNVRGEPIVCKAEEAIEVFVNSGMDALAIGDYLIRK